MVKLLKIDKAVYAVDDKNKTYYFYKRNKNWRKENKDLLYKNKKDIRGYKRILRSNIKRIFRFRNT